MLISLVIRIRPVTQGSLPLAHGPALHAAFFEWLHIIDSTYATLVHDDSGSKPFTLSPIQLDFRETTPAPPGSDLLLSPTKAYWFRITSLDSPLSARLQILYNKPPASLHIMHQTFVVEKLIAGHDEHPWAMLTTYENLANASQTESARLSSLQRTPKLTIVFHSPTTFRANGRSQPLPAPDLVFGSLITRWNTFAPQSIDADFAKTIRDTILINSYDIHTEFVALEGSRKDANWVCFRGWCEYGAFTDNPVWQQTFRMLGRFAFFAGVGYKTTMGFGQIAPRGA